MPRKFFHIIMVFSKKFNIKICEGLPLRTNPMYININWFYQFTFSCILNEENISENILENTFSFNLRNFFVGICFCIHKMIPRPRGTNFYPWRRPDCSETTLTGESRFYISTLLEIEPESLMTGSKGLTRWTSETVYEYSEIAGSAQYSV
jgi:hypothetical protein